MAPLFDSHVDTPSSLLRLRNPGVDNRYGHVDFPKLRRGGVGGSFFALYTPASMGPADATAYALRMIEATREAARAYPEYVSMATTPDDFRKAVSEGRTAIFLGMENASPIQEDLELLRQFYRLGVRYVTLTHNGDNSVADSAAEGSRWGGLSPFGREVVAEMNRLGIMVDLSHASDKTFYDALELSSAPIIASHSCCRALCPHRRNLTDDMLRAIGECGGYVGINFYPAFLSSSYGSSKADAALLDEADEVEARFNANPADPELRDNWNQMQDRLLELPRPGVKEVVDHIERAIRFAGEDHVGIGTDYDGIPVPPEGLEDVSKVGAVAREMLARGLGESLVEKVFSGNLLRVMKSVINRSK
jgi:membrane dipeptidase